MKLDESLRQLFRQYGHGILLEESIVTKLTGLKAFDSSPALREAMKLLSDRGCLKELLTRSRRNDPADFALYTEYLRKFLAAGGKFDEAVVSGAVGSLSSALGHEAAPSLPAEHPARSPESSTSDAGDAQPAPADAPGSPHDDILPEGSPSAAPAACSAEYPTEECLREAAEGGDAKAQVRLAGMYYHGQGAAQDLREAAKWYRKAAEQGNAEAEYRLGEMYFWRQGVEQNSAKAALWYRRAAEKGHAAAQCALAEMYYYSRSRRSVAKAAMWYRKAADQGNVQAKYRLGVMYYRGMRGAPGEEGGHGDRRKAMKWFHEAAADGDADAQKMLGDIYSAGEDGDPDYEKAAGWYREAIANGNADAGECLKELVRDGKIRN